MTISPLALAAKKTIEAAWLHGAAYDLASQAAFALESAQQLQSPETVAELEGLRARVAELEAATYVAPSPSCTRCYGADAVRFVANGGETAPCPVCGPSQVEQLQARVAELEAERHVTNEALDDAVQELRRREGAPLKGRARLDASAAVAAEVTHWRRLGVEDPHDSPLHRTWKVSHDMPETGGAR